MDKPHDDKGLCTLEEAAQEIGTTSLHLLMMAKRGLISAREIDGQWYVDSAAVDDKPAPSQVFKQKQCKGSAGCGGCC